MGQIKIVIPSNGAVSENEDVLSQPHDGAVEALEKADEIKADDLDKIDEGQPERPPYRPIYLSSNAITLANKVQIVVRFYGNPDEIHENYDFVHCTNYWTSEHKEVVLKEAALEALLTKELRYVGSKYPVCSVIRTRKFLGRGWTINAGQYLKMLFQVSELDLKNLDVLEDQLTGVDSAYFFHLIEALRSKQKSDETFKVSADYLSSLVDRIF